MRLLIIGNGIAGLTAADNYRKNDPDADILLVGEEKSLTYWRTRLSHLLGKPDFQENELLVKDAAWYAERRIDVRTETRIVGIDFEKHEAHAESGDTIPYDKLLLATGAHPFVPPIAGGDQKGFFTLHGIEDLRRVLAYLKDREHVVVIGGGLLGLEAAHGLVALGKTVRVLEFFPYLLPRQLDMELSRTVETQLVAEGITFSLGRSCQLLLGEGAVSGIRLDNGEEIPADAVLCSTGVRPDLTLYRGSPLAINKGIVVDDHMRTNLPDVFAAGDIAEYNGVVFGLWSAALEHGKIAGTNLAGGDMRYATPLMVSTLNLGNVKLFSAGTVADPDSVVSFREGNAFHRLFVKDGRVAGAVLTGDMGLMAKARNLVVQKAEVPAGDGGNDHFRQIVT